MDSKQLATLGKQATSFKLNDAYELISKKILINKMSIDSLQKQQELARISIQLQTHSMAAAAKKVELINALNAVFEKQLSEFTEERQQECLDIYRQINELDEVPAEVKSLMKQFEEVQYEFVGQNKRIQSIQETVPSETVVTNYRIKPKVSNSTNCATSTNYNSHRDDDLPV